MTTDVSLFASSGGQVFKPGQGKQLLDVLERQDAATLLTPTVSVQDLVLDRHGNLPEGFRFTAAAFRQVCALLSPGLYRLATDLAGVYPRAQSAREEFSRAEAIHVYNSVLKRRFTTRLEGIRLIRHLEAKRIDGALGARYRWLDNRTFWLHVEEAVRRESLTIRFLGANLSGRRLSLRFANSKALADLPNGGRVHPGYLFVNSEIGGEAPVHGSTLLLTTNPRGYVLGPVLTGQRLIHVGRSFDQRLEALTQEVLNTTFDPNWVKLAYRHAATRKLDIPENRAERKERLAKLVRWLQKRDVPTQLARRAVDAAVLGCPARAADPSPFFTEMVSYPEITLFDLYNALLQCAKPLAPAVRERLERAAYALLRSPSF